MFDGVEDTRARTTRTILRPYTCKPTLVSKHPYAMLLRIVVDHWFLGSRQDTAAALDAKPQTIAYWLTGHEKIPRRVVDQIRDMATARTAASKARLHEWITAELAELTLLRASIEALPDLDRRPYENRARPKGGRPERSQKRRLAATKQSRSAAARDHPDRVPLDLLALLYEPAQPVAEQDKPDQPAQPAAEQSTGKPDTTGEPETAKPGKPVKA